MPAHHTLPAASISSNASPTHKSHPPLNEPPQMRNQPPPGSPVAPCPHIHIPHVSMTTRSHGTLMRSQPSQGGGHRGRRARGTCTPGWELGHPQGWAPFPYSPITRELSMEAKHQKDLRIYGKSQKPKRKKNPRLIILFSPDSLSHNGQ